MPVKPGCPAMAGGGMTPAVLAAVVATVVGDFNYIYIYVRWDSDVSGLLIPPDADLAGSKNIPTSCLFLAERIDTTKFSLNCRNPGLKIMSPTRAKVNPVIYSRIDVVPEQPPVCDDIDSCLLQTVFISGAPVDSTGEIAWLPAIGPGTAHRLLTDFWLVRSGSLASVKGLGDVLMEDPKRMGVQRLILRENALTTVDDAKFVKMTFLQVLDVSSNMITSVKAGALPELLKLLDLSSNKITAVEVGALPKSLTFLDLSGNGITSLPLGLQLPNVEVLDLGCVETESGDFKGNSFKSYPDGGLFPSLKRFYVGCSPLVEEIKWSQIDPDATLLQVDGPKNEDNIARVHVSTREGNLGPNFRRNLGRPNQHFVNKFMAVNLK